MADVALNFHDTDVEWSTDGGTTWNLVDGAKAPSMPKREKDWKDTTDLKSPGRVREFVPGLVTLSDITIPFIFTNEEYAVHLGHDTSGTLVDYRFTLPVQNGHAAGGTFEFSGYPTVSVDDSSGDEGEVIRGTIMIKVSGDFTFTAGA